VTGKWRITGNDVPSLASFDAVLKDYMQAHNISAGALAVTYRGRLVMAHGYTWDLDETYATQPTSLFRIASLSKPFTAAGILKLVQDGKLSLDTRIVDILNFTPAPGETVDPRLRDVTVAHLLYHRGGWDIDALGYDPMFSDARISETLGVPLPISQANIITYMSGVALNHNPGATYAYSNFGYMLLGLIIETVSQQPYVTYMKQNVLEPLDITHMQLGRSILANRLPGEVSYYSDFTGSTVFDTSRMEVPWPYGGWNLENMAAHGGWVANVIDLARFESSFDPPQDNPVLSQDSIQRLFSAPAGITDSRYYAMGWNVQRYGPGSMTTWHGGSLDGTLTLMVRRSDGVDWAAVFNQRESASDPQGKTFWDIDGMLHQAADAVKAWPDHDYFHVSN